VSRVATTTARMGRAVPAVWLDQATDFAHDRAGRPVDGSGVRTRARVGA
jgi:hypothetical protein